MEEIKEIVGRIDTIIQRLRQKTKENGQATSHQNQEEQNGEVMRKNSFKESMKHSYKKESEQYSDKAGELSQKDSIFSVKPNNSNNKETLQQSKIGSSSSDCPICEGKGFIIKNSSKYQDTIVFCQCREMDKTRTLWKNSGIETEKNRLTFGNYKPYNRATEKAKETAKDYFKNFKNIRSTRRSSIAFLGQVGSGKTHLSVAIGLNLLARDIPVVYMSYRDEILKLKQNILDEEFYASCLRRYKLAAVLIIDDLFKGKINDSDINIMFEIVNYRYMNNLRMIISSEFTAERLLYFDEGIGSRIIEMCKDYVVEVEGRENNYRVNN